MHCIDRVLQRVRILPASETHAALRSLPTPVGAVMGVIGLALQTKTASSGTGLFVDEIAKRAFKRRRATQMALEKAESLGLIRRLRQAGSTVGKQKPNLFFVHPVLIAEAQRKDSHTGPALLFPRDWDDLSVANLDAETWPSHVKKQLNSRVMQPPATSRHVSMAKGEQSKDTNRKPTLPTISIDTAEVRKSLTTYFTWVADACRLAGHEPTFQIAGQRRKRDGVRGGVFGPCGLAPEISTRDVVEAAEAAVQWSAAKRVELTFRLCAKAHPLLLLDDLTADSLATLPWPGAIIETSPGSFQVTLVADRPLSPQERLLAQHGLQRHTNADAGAISASQLRRMPGSVNGKFELSEAFVATLRSVPGPGQPRVTEGLVDRFIAAGREGAGAASAASSHRNKPANDVPKTGTTNGQSEADFGWLMHQLTRKFPRRNDELVVELAAKAGARGRHGLSRGHPEHVDYAERTLVACIKKLGTI